MYRKFYKTLSQYLSAIAWIVEDLIQHFWMPWLLASGLTLASPTLQSIAFLLLSSFVIGVAQGGSFPHPLGGEALSYEDESTVALVAIACTGLLVLSSIARYWGDRMFTYLRSDYAEFCIVRGTQAMMTRWNNEPSDILVQIILLIRRDSIFCSRIAASAASTGAPLIEFVVSLSLTLWLYPLITMLVGAIALLGGRSLRTINITGAYHSSHQEQLAPESSRELRSYVLNKPSTDLDQPTHSSIPLSIDSFPVTKEWLHSLLEYIMVMPLSRLVTGILTGLIIGAIVIGLGLQIQIDTSQLNRSLTYLIALRYLVRSFQQIIGNLSSLNRFYNQAKRYRSIVTGQLPAEVFTRRVSSDDEEEEDL